MDKQNKSAEEIKRFDITPKFNDFGMQEFSGMDYEVCPDGDWVQFEDHEKHITTLQQANAELKKDIEAITQQDTSDEAAELVFYNSLKHIFTDDSLSFDDFKTMMRTDGPESQIFNAAVCAINKYSMGLKHLVEAEKRITAYQANIIAELDMQDSLYRTRIAELEKQNAELVTALKKIMHNTTGSNDGMCSEMIAELALKSHESKK